MPNLSKRKHHTELESAGIVSSGSGNIYVSGSFIPAPTLPVNNCNLPHRHPRFVGRQQEISNIIEALASRAWIITIDGMGGIGKTTLALEVAHLCKEQKSDYPNPNTPRFSGFIWVSARDKPGFSLADVVKQVIDVLSPIDTKGRRLSQQEELGLANRALASGPHLLIIDNFETVKDEPLHRFLRDQLPSPSKVLITSRHHIKTGERVVTIGGLEEDTAVQLLRLEAQRLQIPLNDKDTIRLHVIARKAYGIPLVLRWAMEMVYNGRTLEWVLQSLEDASADEIFDYIFERSLSTLDHETHSVFRSISLFPTWAKMETIEAINPTVAVVQERVAHLVSLSLLEDNRNLVETNRRYQLHPFTRYLATKELLEADDKGINVLENTITHYLAEIRGFQSFKNLDAYLEDEFANISSIIHHITDTGNSQLLERAIQLCEAIGQMERERTHTLLGYLSNSVKTSSDKTLTLRLLAVLGDPYDMRAPVTSKEFFGRKEVINFIQETFERGEMHTPAISLVGPRKIGKTSLLLELIRQAAGRCIYVYTDLQGLPYANSNELLFYLAEGISGAIVSKGIDISKPSEKEFENQPYIAFDSYLEKVQSRIGNLRLVLIMDEFDLIYFPRNEKQRQDIGDLLSFFRSMIQHQEIGLLIAGITPPYEMPTSVASSPFFNIVSVKQVSGIDRDSAIELIRQLVYGLVEYEHPAIEYLLRLSGNYPFILREFCSLILHHCVKEGTLIVDLGIVKETESVYLSKSSFYVQHLLKERLPETEQKLVSVAASLLETAEDSFTPNQLKEAIAPLKMQTQQLRNLVQREILKVDDQGNYKFFADIYRLFLREFLN